MLVVAIPAAAPSATAAALAVAMAFLAALRLALFRLLPALLDRAFVGLSLGLDDDIVVFLLDRRGRQELLLLEALRLLGDGAAQDGVVLRADRLVDLDGDRQAEARLQLGQRAALVVEHVERGRGRRLDDDVLRWNP